MLHLSEWEAKAWLAVLSGVIVGCVATIWMAVENEIQYQYAPHPVETYQPVPYPVEHRTLEDLGDTDEFGRRY